jgi:hypothetical protein
MGQKFAAYDAQGSIYGFYDSIDSPLPHGVIAIEITDEQWQTCIVTPGYTVRDGGLVAPVAPTEAQVLCALIPDLCVQIDAAADAVYVAIGGPSPGRLAEYQQANMDALSFKASGYAGDVPATIECQCIAAAMTSREAADDIIATAANWNAALVAIRSARLIGKGKVTASETVALAESAASTAIEAINAVAAASR